MEEYIGVYKNPHGVEICQHIDESLSLACDWPGESEEAPISVSLAFECETTSEFAESFGLLQITDLDKITPYTVLEMYKKAKAEVSCSINDYNSYSLNFRIKGNKLFATADPGGEEHEVRELIMNPDHFKEYTFNYFRPIAL